MAHDSESTVVDIDATNLRATLIADLQLAPAGVPELLGRYWPGNLTVDAFGSLRTCMAFLSGHPPVFDLCGGSGRQSERLRGNLRA